MRTRLRFICLPLTRPVLLTAWLLALPWLATAQSVPASGSTSSMGMSAMPQMDHGDMPGMAMPAAASRAAKPATTVPATQAGKKPVPVPSTQASHDMDDMDHGSMPGMDHGAKPATPMGPMQGGNPPPNARSPDYSDGLDYGSMQGMEMADKLSLGMLLIDRLEAFHGRDGDGQSWEAEGWYGDDGNKLWLRSEGEHSRGKLDDGDLEAFWNHAVAAYWSTQLGARQDLGEGPGRSWAALGVQGLAPYRFELEATAYAGASGRTAGRLRVDYELLFTQRLILQPELEANFYGKDDPQRRIGRGLSDVQFGLRLRYEVQRQFAPYIGVNWVRRIGTTADYARQDHQPVLDRQIAVGVRIWF
ncbi:copper resistance protein B [Rhodanobacter sp. B05]|uniref:copper resistance protein B n=1 Tax=Rhodanobacter sp. B05 TaxID=1945859 RepID=UPI00157DC98E|nr:copper resistance protein B [Rhodanobacter sp. B05]